jgi:hypothetical protein
VAVFVDREERDISPGHRVSVEAGKETELTVEIPPGVMVDGIVLDYSGIPVGGAEIRVFRDLLLSDVVAHTAADGTFHVRDVANNKHLGARAPGFSPSNLYNLTGIAGSRVFVRLVLAGRGGELIGQVLGAEHTPVPDVGVILGDFEKSLRFASFEDGSTGVRPPAHLAVTDEDGRFRFWGVPAGKL